MNKNDRKIFVIGLNKCATCTIHLLFEENGCCSTHNTFWDLDKYDCFTDGDHAGETHPSLADGFKKLEKEWPHALFILNTRKLNTWILSRFKHGVIYEECWGATEPQPYWYPPSIQKAKRWIFHRDKHYANVFDYFREKPQKLIIVNTEDPEWIKFLCEILKFDNNNIKSQNITANITKFRTPELTRHLMDIKNIINLAFIELDYSSEQQNRILLDDNKNYLEIYKNNVAPQESLKHV